MSPILKKDLIYNQLYENIMSGKLTGKLPTEIAFARELGVGKITLRAALERLHSESLVSRIHGRGTFVLSAEERSNKEKTLILIVNGSTKRYSPENYIIPEALRYATRHGFIPEIIDSSRFVEFSEHELKTYVERRNIRGILLMQTSFIGDEAIIAKVKSIGLPVVLPHAESTDNEVTGFAAISINSSAAVDAAIEYLVKHGHRKIAFIGYNKVGKPSFRKESLEDVLTILKKHGCSNDPDYFPFASYGKDISDKVIKMFSTNNMPTALILYSDFFATYTYRAIKKIGKRIPDDISVIGLCGYPDVDMVTPHLSTVDFQYSLLAQKGIDLLINHREWFCPGKRGPLVYSDFKIVERESISNIKKQSRIRREKRREPVLV